MSRETSEVSVIKKPPGVLKSPGGYIHESG